MSYGECINNNIVKYINMFMCAVTVKINFKVKLVSVRLENRKIEFLLYIKTWSTRHLDNCS